LLRLLQYALKSSWKAAGGFKAQTGAPIFMNHKVKETIELLPSIPRDAAGLRDALFDEINLLRAGKVNTSHAYALANLVRQLIDAARLEFQNRALMHDAKTLKLGSK